MINIPVIRSRNIGPFMRFSNHMLQPCNAIMDASFDCVLTNKNNAHKTRFDNSSPEQKLKRTG